MEDGIETYRVKIFDTKYNEEKPEYIYVHTPLNGHIIIIHNKKMAINYSKENSCKIEVFEKEIKGFYRFINEFYVNGNYYKIEDS